MKIHLEYVNGDIVSVEAIADVDEFHHLPLSWKHFDVIAHVKDLSQEPSNTEDISGQRQETPESQ